MAETSGFIVQMTDILALPDKEGCSILVNLEFRNCTWSLVPHPRQSKFENGFSPGVLLFALSGILGQGRNHASQRE